MVTTAGLALGGLDVLVTVVGGLIPFGVSFNRLDEVTDDAWDLIFDINLKYVKRVAPGRAPGDARAGHRRLDRQHRLRRRNGQPRLANMAAYGAAKAGLANLVKTVAVEYGAAGIRMNVVSPGPTETGATWPCRPSTSPA